MYAIDGTKTTDVHTKKDIPATVGEDEILLYHDKQIAVVPDGTLLALTKYVRIAPAYGSDDFYGGDAFDPDEFPFKTAGVPKAEDMFDLNTSLSAEALIQAMLGRMKAAQRKYKQARMMESQKGDIVRSPSYYTERSETSDINYRAVPARRSALARLFSTREL